MASTVGFALKTWYWASYKEVNIRPPNVKH